MKGKKSTFAVTIFSILTAMNVIFIWSNSSMPFSESSKQSTYATSILAQLFRKLQNVDPLLLELIVRKCAHFAEFFCLGALAFAFTLSLFGFDFKRARVALPLTALGCLFAASTDEMIQIFSDRGNSVYDVLLDFSGSLSAIVILSVIFMIVSHVKKRREKREKDDQTSDIEDAAE